MTQHRWFLVAGQFLLAVLSTGCFLSGTTPVPTPKIAPPIDPPIAVVADVLGMLAFEGVLKFQPVLEGEAHADASAKVQSVIDKLKAASPDIAKAAKNWRVLVVKSDSSDAAAFQAAGFVVSSQLVQCGRSCLEDVDEGRKSRRATAKKDAAKADATALEKVLAVSLSHEISHLTENHFTARVKANADVALTAVKAAVGAKIASGAVPKSPEDFERLVKEIKLDDKALAALIGATGLTIALEAGGHPFMLEQERSSDCKGVELMQRAGFDPNDALKFWSRTPSEDTGRLFATHPANEQRLADLEKCVARVATVTKKPTQVAARKR